MGLISGRPLKVLKKPVVKEKKKAEPKQNILTLIQQIKINFDKYLSQFKDDYEVIHKREDLERFISKCEDIVAIDTETTGLSIDDRLVGVCVYSPGQKAIYVPVYHVDCIINKDVEEVASKEDIHWFVSELNKKKLIYHNAAFDLRVLKVTTGVDMQYPYWDTLVGAHLSNFDKNQRGLKDQYNKYIAKDDGAFGHYADLFEGLTLEKLPINLVYIYAARDAFMTYELYKYQKTLFEGDYKEQQRVFELELKLTKVVSEMKIEGVYFDKEYTEKMSEGLNKELEEVKAELYDIVSKSVGITFDMRKFDPNSPVKLKELLFKYLKLKFPRGTNYSTVKVNEETLTGLNHPVCEKLLEYRKLFKQVNTYVDKMHNVVDSDGCIHSDFNSFGAITGRFSSSNPNFQNISNEFKSPKGNKYNIRGMFTPKPGDIWIGADYSGQEVRVAAAIAKDKNLYEAFEHGKDIHAFMASLSFHQPYEECLEFRPEDDPQGRWKKGDVNKEGKARRKRAKSVTFGLAYGTSAEGLAGNIGCSVEEAQEVMDAYFNAFPTIKDAIEKAQEYGKTHGYVKTLLNRIRPIDHILEGPYVVELVENTQFNFDPDLNSTDGVDELSPEMKQEIIENYEKLTSWKDKRSYEDYLKRQNILIKNNTGDYNSALRQCFNSWVQGTSAEQTKIALVKIFEDQRLRDLGARIVISIHDENIITVPVENKDLAAKYLEEDMLAAANEVVDIVFKSDVEFYERWK